MSFDTFSQWLTQVVNLSEIPERDKLLAEDLCVDSVGLLELMCELESLLHPRARIEFRESAGWLCVNDLYESYLRLAQPDCVDPD